VPSALGEHSAPGTSCQREASRSTTRRQASISSKTADDDLWAGIKDYTSAAMLMKLVQARHGAQQDHTTRLLRGTDSVPEIRR
jgi:hypothetical protein